MDKTVTQAISGGAVWLSGGALLLKLVSFLNIIFILRHLSVYEYGVAELVLSIIPLLSPFLVPGLSYAVVADMGVEKGKGNLSGVRQLVDNFFKLQFFLCFIAWAIIFFGANAISHFYPESIGNYFRVVSFIFLLAPFRSMFSIFLNVHLRFFQQSLLSLIEECSKLFFLFVFFALFTNNTLALLTAIVFSQFAMLAAGAPFFLKVYRSLPRPVQKVPFWHLLRNHGKWSIFSAYLGSFTQGAQLWIIKFMTNTEAVALFAVAQGFIGHIVSLLPTDKILTPIIPRYAHDEQKLYRIMHTGIKYQLAGGILVSAAAFLFAPTVISLIVPKYLPSMELFRILLFSIPILGFVPVFNGVFFAFKKQRNLFFANLVYKTVPLLTFTPILIYFFGIKGIALAGVLAALFFVSERYKVVRKILPRFKINFKELLSIDEYDLIIFNELLYMFRLKKIV